MGIRKWFGSDIEYDETTSFNSNIDELLSFYWIALLQYFGMKSSTSLKSMLDELNNELLYPGQVLFKQWLEVRGIEQLQEIASLTHTDDESRAIGNIYYEIFILREEMDFNYPEDARATLIGIANDLVSILTMNKEISGI